MTTNINFFIDNLHPQNITEYKNILQWYNCKIKPSLFYINDKGKKAIHKISQYGGEIKIYSVFLNGQKYTVNVNKTAITQSSMCPDPGPDPDPDKLIDSKIVDDGQTITDDKIIEIETMKPKHILDYQGDEIIHFLSLQNSDKLDESCAVIKIYNKYGIAEIEDINKLHNCFTPVNVTKSGELMIEIVLDFIIKNKKSLGVNKIILYDKSIYECHEIYDVKLEYSRQLSGLDPYYMKYKFKPVMLSAIDKLNYNKYKLSQIYTRDVIDIIDKILSKANSSDKSKLIEYLIQHKNELLTKTIHNINCHWLYLIYGKLFKKLGLKKLLYVESMYELDI